MTDEEAREDLDFEIAFLEAVLERNPRNIEALKTLGHAYTDRGLFEQGLAIDLRLVRLRPEDALAHYNLACSYSILGYTDEAVEALRRALDRGYGDVDYMMRDPDLANVRKDPRFRQLLRSRIQPAREE